MESWTEGQWMEWLDSRRDAAYTPEDASSDEVYRAWKSEFPENHHSFFFGRVIHTYIDWEDNSDRFKEKLANVIRSRRQWYLDKLKHIRPATPWQWAVKHIITNMAKTV